MWGGGGGGGGHDSCVVHDVVKVFVCLFVSFCFVLGLVKKVVSQSLIRCSLMYD